jgi:hypothetical protein
MVCGIARSILFIWILFIVLTAAAYGFGVLQQRDTLVYAAQVEGDIRATDVRLYDVQSGLSTDLFRRIDLMDMDISADGRYLLITQRLLRGRELQIVHLASGTVTALHAGALDVPRWSPDGQWVAYRHTEMAADGIYRMPVTGGEPIRIAAPNVIYSLSNDGAFVYYSAWGTNDASGIIRQNIATGEKSSLLADRLYITDMAVHDEWLAYVGNYQPDIINVTTGDVYAIPYTVGVGSLLAWSLDGERLAVATGFSADDTNVLLLNREGDLLRQFSLPNRLYGSRFGWATLR